MPCESTATASARDGSGPPRGSNPPRAPATAAPPAAGRPTPPPPTAASPTPGARQQYPHGCPLRKNGSGRGFLARQGVGFGQGVDQRIELPFEHAVKVVEREPDAVIGDAVLAEVVRADLAAPFARADLHPPRAADLLLLPAQLRLEQARP